MPSALSKIHHPPDLGIARLTLLPRRPHPVLIRSLHPCLSRHHEPMSSRKRLATRTFFPLSSPHLLMAVLFFHFDCGNYEFTGQWICVRTTDGPRHARGILVLYETACIGHIRIGAAQVKVMLILHLDRYNACCMRLPESPLSLSTRARSSLSPKAYTLFHNSTSNTSAIYCHDSNLYYVQAWSREDYWLGGFQNQKSMLGCYAGGY